MAGKAIFLCCISAWIWVPRRANFFQGHDRQPNAQAVDLGTSACKFLLVDETGKVCNQVSREYPLSMPHTGWSEQDPSSWWQACLDGIPALLEVYATTLHYAPCHTDPAYNKWLRAHPDSAEAAQGAVAALTGENIDIEKDL